MKAVILAAGKGRRMRHLTAYLPKPLLTVKDRPVIGWILDGLGAAGIAEYCVVTGYLGDAIVRLLGDGRSRNIHIEYRRQAQTDGTATALSLARSFVSNDPFLLTYGDVLTAPGNYQALITAYQHEGSPGVIGVGPNEPGAEGAGVLLDTKGCVSKLLDRSTAHSTSASWQYTGIAVLAPEVFRFTTNLRRSPGGEHEFTDVLLAMIHAGHRLRAYELKEAWIDIRDPESLKRAERIM